VSAGVRPCGCTDVRACGKVPGKSKLEVIVDGLVYQLQERGGISRLFSEIMPRMCDVDDSLKMLLLTQGRLRQPLPVHRSITHRAIPPMERYLKPKRIWKSAVPSVNRLIRQLWVGSGEGRIWHSTYYSVPNMWQGRSVATLHDMIFERFPEFFKGRNADLFRETKRRCVESAQAIICVSETTRREVRNFYNLGNDRLHVVPNAYSDVFRRIEQFDQNEFPIGEPFLLYIGKRSKYKNFDLLIEAYASWTGKKDIALVLVGCRPWSDQEKKQLDRLNIHNRVHILSSVTDEELCRLYNRAVAFVYPSLYEGFGIPLLEAMACGCPIIASRIPSTLEVAGDYPIYFNPTDAEELRASLETALSEGRRPERLLLGLEKTASYSWDHTAKKTLKVYHAVKNHN